MNKVRTFLFAQCIPIQKVNAKNAFNIDLECLDNVKDFIKTQNPDKKWIRTGEAIDAGAKVYGFRVDNVHHTAYKMLNVMSRNVSDQLGVIKEDEESEEVEDEEEKKQGKKKKAIRKHIDNNFSGEKTLDKESNLNLNNFDQMILHQVDPLFKKTTQRFDEMSLSTLMSSTLDVSSNLQLQLDSFLSSEGKLKDFETN